MSRTVLVTGGAGFVGSHIVDLLIESSYEVIVYDDLMDQVHDGRPEYLNDEAEFVQGDIRNRSKLRPVIERADVVSHHAALVGVGQSMYEIQRYVDANVSGTGTLLDIITEEEIDIDKLVLASTMSIYGEGAYYCGDCEDRRYPSVRDADALESSGWEPRCEVCKTELDPRGISESAPVSPSNVYAITKQSQENLSLAIGKAYDIPTVALRYFSIYGSRQSLDNPYTGVCSIFSSRIKNGEPPILFEDGYQTRDFVHVSDVARANRLAIESDEVGGEILNIGSGTPVSIRDLAKTMLRLYGRADQLDIEVTGKFRESDVRHVYADVSKTKEMLGFTAETNFEDGLKELLAWTESHNPTDLFDQAFEELEEQDLLKDTE